ncbi:MAG: rod shape determining protein RodA [Candidatus Sumerlaeota bacterium]|nr:rod shape determining protein RodA [Candidatus Sumerlaeota bacterium]
MSLVEFGAHVPTRLGELRHGAAVERQSGALGRPAHLLTALRHLDLPMAAAIVTLTTLGLWLLFGTVQGSGFLLAAADRQITWFGLSIVAFLVVLLPDYRWLGKLATVAYASNLVLLVLVLFLGTTVNGATSWFRLGPISFQPAETMKVSTVMMLAHWFALRPEGVERPRDLLLPGLLCAVPAALILKQPDLGTASLFGIVFFSMLFWAGVKRWILVAMILAGLTCAAGTYPLLKPYQKERLKTFVDPARDPRGSGYNVIQSFIAVGSGGIAGRGWGQGTQSVHRYLPEAHTDFVFASAVEQTGFLGAMMILGLYGVVFWRILVAVRNARDRFGGLLVVGLGAILMGHILMNIGMCIGLFPVTGLPLPFLSYGGSFLLAMFVLVGLILNVSMRRFLFSQG